MCSNYIIDKYCYDGYDVMMVPSPTFRLQKQLPLVVCYVQRSQFGGQIV